MIYEDPDVVAMAIPFMLVAVLLELFLGKKKKLHRVNDSITSLTSGGLLLLLGKLLPWFFFASIELTAYAVVYKKFHLVEISLDSWLAHFIVFLGVDLGYYWAHRMSHEVNLFWAGHVVHHSSNFYNLTTALRQSFLQTYNVWFYYLPMALILPPRIYYIQKGINTVYQFWVHTQLVPKLGPIEWIFNTPSHHRVHHARNRKYIDKNYAGVLIIWDRLFGTFEPESEDEEVIYGLVHPLRSFNPIWVQTHHLVHVLQGAYNISGFTNKLSVLFKGPGWQPGKPRLGDNNDIPDIPANQKIIEGPAIPVGVRLYTISQFITTLVVFFTVMELQGPQSIVTTMGFFVVISYCSLGAFFDKKEYSIVLEWARLVAAALFVRTELFLNVFPDKRVKEGVHFTCVASFMWLCYISYNHFSTKRFPLLFPRKLVHTKKHE